MKMSATSLLCIMAQIHVKKFAISTLPIRARLIFESCDALVCASEGRAVTVLAVRITMAIANGHIRMVCFRFVKGAPSGQCVLA
jgi:hypothetical protein